MEDEAVRERLEAAAAACEDGGATQQSVAVEAICTAVASCLEGDASSSTIPAIAQFVRESPWSVAIVQQLISTRTSCDDVLDALLPIVIDMEETHEGADGRLELLTTFFALALQQVQSPEQSDAAMAMAMAWAERVLQVVYTLEVQTALEREVVRQIVVLLVKMEAALPSDAEFKVLTLVWKHLTKLSQSFNQVLTEQSLENDSSGEDAAATSTRVDAAALLVRVTCCFEQWAMHLHEIVCSESDTEQARIASLVRSLKIMRLYWRAFQGLFRSFARSHMTEVENCVLGLVHSTALLEATIVKATKMSLPSKCIVELSRQLTMQLGFVEKLPTDEVIGTDIIAIVRGLLGHPQQDMERALSERQSLLVNEAPTRSNSLPNEVRWVHLLLHTGLSVSCDEDQEEEGTGDSPVAKVLEQYRECALRGSINHKSASFGHFIDFIIGFLLKMSDHMGFLIQQTFHPAAAQRILFWRIWNECMMKCWSETQAIANLQALFNCALWEGNSTIVKLGVRRDIMDLVAFLYSDMSEVLKRKCLDTVTTIVDLICRDGPTHSFTLSTAAQIELLDVLVTAKFLVDYDHPEKEDWIQHYLPMSLECCGTILDLLSKSSPPTTKIQIDEFYGRVRVLDVCLLVIRAVFDDNEPRKAELGELMLIVVPLCTEALTQISKLGNFPTPQVSAASSSACSSTMRSLHRPKPAHPPRQQDAMLLDDESRRSSNRILETALYLLAKVGPALKQNRNNECAQVVKDLTHIVNVRNDMNVPVACFVKSTLFDVEVAECDHEIMWQLFSQLFRKLLAPSIKNEHASDSSYREIICFDAFLAFLMNSNLIESKSQNVREILDGATNIRFMKYVALIKLDPAERTLIKQQAHRDSWAENMQQSLVLRFPEKANAPKSHEKRIHELVDEERHNSGDASGPHKRQKLDQLVSILGVVYNKLRSLPPTSNTVLTDEDFESATSFVEYLSSRI